MTIIRKEQGSYEGVNILDVEIRERITVVDALNRFLPWGEMAKEFVRSGDKKRLIIQNESIENVIDYEHNYVHNAYRETPYLLDLINPTETYIYDDRIWFELNDILHNYGWSFNPDMKSSYNEELKELSYPSEEEFDDEYRKFFETLYTQAKNKYLADNYKYLINGIRNHDIEYSAPQWVYELLYEMDSDIEKADIRLSKAVKVYYSDIHDFFKSNELYLYFNDYRFIYGINEKRLMLLLFFSNLNKQFMVCVENFEKEDIYYLKEFLKKQNVRSDSK